jgi:hypothetical protein
MKNNLVTSDVTVQYVFLGMRSLKWQGSVGEDEETHTQLEDIGLHPRVGVAKEHLRGCIGYRT